MIVFYIKSCLICLTVTSIIASAAVCLASSFGHVYIKPILHSRTKSLFTIWFVCIAGSTYNGAQLELHSLIVSVPFTCEVIDVISSFNPECSPKS